MRPKFPLNYLVDILFIDIENTGKLFPANSVDSIFRIGTSDDAHL